MSFAAAVMTCIICIAHLCAGICSENRNKKVRKTRQFEINQDAVIVTSVVQCVVVISMGQGLQSVFYHHNTKHSGLMGQGEIICPWELPPHVVLFWMLPKKWIKSSFIQMKLQRFVDFIISFFDFSLQQLLYPTFLQKVHKVSYTKSTQCKIREMYNLKWGTIAT